MHDDPFTNEESSSFDEIYGEIDADEIEAKVNAGELTSDEAAQLLQQAARRKTAMEGPTLDTDEEGRITTGGFGSGQGMEKQRTGQ
ncbi:MAG: hypothetical protein ACJ789_13850 [Thermomicrobiales bacterium]